MAHTARTHSSGGSQPGLQAGGSRWLVSEDLLELAARRLRVLGHPLRLRVLESLATGPRSVSDVAELVGVAAPVISKHLGELLRIGLVTRRQEGNFAVYSLPDAWAVKAVALVCRGITDERKRLAALAEAADAAT